MKFFLFLCTFGLAWTAFAIWPDGVFDTPLSRLTLGMIFRALGTAVLVVWAFFTALSAFEADSGFSSSGHSTVSTGYKGETVTNSINYTPEDQAEFEKRNRVALILIVLVFFVILFALLYQIRTK